MTAKLLVMGATGNIGGELARQLAAAGHATRLVVRDPHHPALPAGAELAVADLDRPEELGPIADGIESAFLIGGRRDLPGLLARLRAAGVEHVVLLTSRSVIGMHAGNAIAEMWASSESALLASGLSWTILRPSGFMSNALRWRDQLRAGDVIRTPFADVPIAAIHPADLAGVAAAALTSRAYVGRQLELSGPAALTPILQTEILAAALHRPLRCEPLSDADTRAELARTMPPAFAEAMLGFFARGEFDDSPVVPTVRDVLGRAPLAFEAWAASNAAAF